MKRYMMKKKAKKEKIDRQWNNLCFNEMYIIKYDSFKWAYS